MCRLGNLHLFRIVPLLAYILLNISDSVRAVSIYNYNGISTTIAGDVIVAMNQTSWRCDRIFCPIGTDRCKVLKYQSPSDQSKQIRENYCLAANDTELVSQSFIEDINPNGSDELNLIVSSTGASIIQQNGNSRNLTSEEVEEINRTVYRTIQRSQETLRRNLQHARETINNAFKSIPFFNGYW